MVHCIDLMFKDINKRPSVAKVTSNALKITNFNYNHGWLFAQIRKFYGGDIVQPGAMRCASNYITLVNLLKNGLI